MDSVGIDSDVSLFSGCASPNHHCCFEALPQTLPGSPQSGITTSMNRSSELRVSADHRANHAAAIRWMRPSKSVIILASRANHRPSDVMRNSDHNQMAAARGPAFLSSAGVILNSPTHSFRNEKYLPPFCRELCRPGAKWILIR
jgi:hypothetical protein